MKYLLLAIGALLVISGIVSVNLWLGLRTERLQNTHLKTQLTEASMTLRTSVNSAQQIADPAAATGVSGSPAATVATPLLVDREAALKATEASVNAGAVAAAKGSSDAQLMKDPEYRKAQLTMNRLRLAQSNPGLAEALGLSEKETNHLFEVMAESQLNRSTELTEALSRARPGGGAATPALAEVLRNTGAREDPARAALGEAKYAQYQEYQRNVRPALLQVASIGSSLDAAGQPLNDSQTRTLTAAMMTEQQRLRQEATMPRPITAPRVARSLADMMQEDYARQEASNNRILEASSWSLNAAQLDVLKQQFEQQAAQRRRTIETAKDMDARRVPLPAPTTAPAKAP